MEKIIGPIAVKRSITKSQGREEYPTTYNTENEG
jgi:hypothetical protein